MEDKVVDKHGTDLNNWKHLFPLNLLYTHCSSTWLSRSIDLKQNGVLVEEGGTEEENGWVLKEKVFKEGILAFENRNLVSLQAYTLLETSQGSFLSVKFDGFSIVWCDWLMKFL